MALLTEQSIIRMIRSGTPFAATIKSGGFSIKVEEYVPVLCTAIHDGHEVESPFDIKMQVDDRERRFEEDPYTAQLIAPFPITLSVHHSRYFYDVNRPPGECVYDVAWGKQVWRRELSAAEKRYIMDFHGSYYRVLAELLDALEKRFGRCIVYDLHTFNHSRLRESPPLFNIGTYYANLKLYEEVLLHLANRLNEMELDGCEVRTAFDEVFQGRGYQAQYIHSSHPESLCVPLEIKKEFMDEESFGLKQPLSNSLFFNVREALADNAENFATTKTRFRLDRQNLLRAG